MLTEPLLAAFARLDQRLEHVATQQERRAALLAGDGSSGWEAVRNLARADLRSLLTGGFSDPIAPTAPDNPIVRLTRCLGLAQNAADMILVLLAPWVEPRYGTLYALLQDDPMQPNPTERFLRSALASDPNEIGAVSDLLRAGSPLRTTGIVVALPGQFAPLNQPFSLADDMVSALLGRRDIDIAGAAQSDWRQGSKPTSAAQPATAQKLVTQVLYGSSGLRTAALAKYDWQATVGYVRPDGSLAIEAAKTCAATAWRMAVARGVNLVLDLRGLDETVAGDVAQMIAARGRSFGTVVQLLARRPLPVALPHTHVTPIGWQARVSAWQSAAAEKGISLSQDVAERLASRHVLSDAARADVINAAVASPGTDLDVLAQAHRMQAPQHAVQREVRMRFDDLVLRQMTRAGLERMAYFVSHRARLSEDMPGKQLFQMENGPVALFHGVPGTGKTVAAEALAHRLGCPLYVVDLSQVVSKYVGETEKHIHDTLMEAEASSALLFFDEADALFSRRVEKASSGGEQFSNMVMGYLLQRIEAHHGPIILATNLSQGLDEALMRRFRFRIEFPLPNKAERALLWDKMLGSDTGLDLRAVADAHKLSGGEIRNAALKAVFLADERKTPLSATVLNEAIRMELHELGRLAREDPAEGLPKDAGVALRSAVEALDDALETHLRAVFVKDIHIIVGPPTERNLSGKRPALSLAMYRLAGRRGADGLRTGFILSAWCARPEEEHDILGVVHSFLAQQPVLPGGSVKLRLQESHDFELLQRFWSSHDQPMKPALVLEAELT